MNVKAGDLARIVGTGQCNDGAVVRVIAYDDLMAWSTGYDWWFVTGEQLALFFNRPWPNGVGNGATCPGRNLQRIPPDDLPEDVVDELEVTA